MLARSEFFLANLNAEVIVCGFSHHTLLLKDEEFTVKMAVCLSFG